jgi:hypothetical protein
LSLTASSTQARDRHRMVRGELRRGGRNAQRGV